MPEVPQQPAADRWPTLSADDREYYRMVYVTGGMSLIALCRQYSLGYESVRKFAMRKGWNEERDKTQAQFADGESDELGKILADVRRVLLSSFRSICYWYQEQLHTHEVNNTVNAFPLDEWAGKLNTFIELVEKTARLAGVSKEVMLNSTVNNTQVNVNVGDGGKSEPGGPPGVHIPEEAAKKVIGSLLVEMMRQTRPQEIVVVPEQQTGAR